MHKLDIWNQWNRTVTLIVDNKDPVINGSVYIYVHGEKGLEETVINKMYKNHGASENVEMVTDALINVLYFAAFRAQCGVCVYGLIQEDIITDAQELQTLAGEIDQLATIYGMKTGQITPSQLVQELRDATVYYSSMEGPNAQGENTEFTCAYEDGVHYYPVFLLPRHLHEFFAIFKRTDYPVLECTLEAFLNNLLSAPKPMGTVIEPLYNCGVALGPGFRVD